MIEVAASRRGVGKNALALIGISTGAIAEYNVLQRRKDVRAGVVDSGYGLTDADLITAPILLLGSSADQIHYTNQQRDLHSLQAAGKTVEAYFYPDADHVVTQDPRVGPDRHRARPSFPASLPGVAGSCSGSPRDR